MHDERSLGIQFDVWHLWNSESLYDDIEQELSRFVGVHVCDVRHWTRGWADRALPGVAHRAKMQVQVPRQIEASLDGSMDTGCKLDDRHYEDSG